MLKRQRPGSRSRLRRKEKVRDLKKGRIKVGTYDIGRLRQEKSFWSFLFFSIRFCIAFVSVHVLVAISVIMIHVYKPYALFWNFLEQLPEHLFALEFHIPCDNPIQNPCFLIFRRHYCHFVCVELGGRGGRGSGGTSVEERKVRHVRLRQCGNMQEHLVRMRAHAMIIPWENMGV